MSAVVFVAVRILPADPALMLAGEYARPGELEAIRAALGLDQPIYVQYGRWLAQVVRGDLGRSIRTQRPVSEIFFARVPATLELALSALAIGVVVGLPLGVVGGTRRGSWVDQGVRTAAVLWNSTPHFFLGMALILVFGVYLEWLPTFGYGDWRHFILPTATLASFVVALVARIVRASILEVLSADYIRTARAKGLARPVVIWRHALRNALIPVVTVVGLQFGNLIGGAVVTEAVFAWPGIGTAAYQAILERDYPVIQAVVLYASAGIIATNLIVDLLYIWLAPQIRTE